MKLKLLKTSIEIYRSFIIEAALKDLIDRLKTIGVSNDIISYIENSPANFQGIAANEVLKNNSITILELDEKLSALKSKQEKIKELKEKSKIDIDVPKKYKQWFSDNINKYKDLNIVGNKDKIIAFFESGGYNPMNFTAKEVLDKLEEKTEDPNMQKFFGLVIEKENDALSVLKNKKFAQYCKRRFEEFRIEWKKKIIKELNNTGKSFQDLMQEQADIYQDIQQGKYLDKELPHTPLIHHEHNALLDKSQILDTFVDETHIDYTKYSIDDLIKECIKWNKKTDRSQTGKGLHYDPVVIFAGPTWDNEDFNGYIVVELKSVNDLRVEGLLMNHCVGDGRYDDLLGKSCRIFSIRDSSDMNSPLCTIETNISVNVIRQCLGYHDNPVPKLFMDIAKSLIIEGANKLMEEIKKGNFENIDYKHLENENIRKAITDAAKIGNESAIEKLNSNYKDMRPIIIDLVKDGYEKAIEKLDSSYDNMRPIIIDLAKQKNKIAIEKLVSYYDDMRPIIIDLAKDGYEIAIKQLDPIHDDMRQIIINLAKQENETAIMKLDPHYPDMMPTIIELLNNNNQIMIKKLKYLISHFDNVSANLLARFNIK